MENRVRGGSQGKLQILTWSIIGGIPGALVGILYGIIIPTQLSPGAIIITYTILGMFGGGLIAVLRYMKNKDQEGVHLNDGGVKKLQLREEQLNITKKPIQKAEVSIHKEVFREEKNIIVPVIREDLVIERNDLEKSEKETIRIPMKKERFIVTKYPEVINDVSVYKNKFKENKRIFKTLKKEKLRLEIAGNPKIKKVNLSKPVFFAHRGHNQHNPALTSKGYKSK